MLKIGSDRLRSSDLNKVIYSNEKIEIDKKALNKVKKSFSFLEAFSKDKIIYGINTGFGPMAQYRVSEE